MIVKINKCGDLHINFFLRFREATKVSKLYCANSYLVHVWGLECPA